MNYRRGRGGLGMAGYTITEVLIVLAVTAAMFVAIVLSFQGGQARAEFTQSVRSFEARVQNIISEVTSGSYDTLNCSAGGASGAPTLNTATNTPGSCIFIGKIFGTSTAYPVELFNIRTLVGRRTTGSPPTDVTTIAQAEPVSTDVTEWTFGFGLQITKMIDLADEVTELQTLGFVVPLAGSGLIQSDFSAGSRHVGLYGLRVGDIFDNGNGLLPLADGALVCLKGSNDQRAEITIGKDGSPELLVSTLDTANAGACQSA